MGSTYYKVTERIETSRLATRSGSSTAERSCCCGRSRSACGLLHEIDVVHGDLKPRNVLVQKKPDSPFHVAKLIDFDDSYVSGKPPAPTSSVATWSSARRSGGVHA